MFKNLIKTAVRHILKHFGYSILNILGLTLGISSALFLIIYVDDEVSYESGELAEDGIKPGSRPFIPTFMKNQTNWLL